MTAIQINAERLRHEMALRGLDAAQLSRIAGVSEATLSAASRGRRVSTRTLQKISVALTRTPKTPGVELLI